MINTDFVNVIYQTRIHWISFVKPVVLMMISFPFVITFLNMEKSMSIKLVFCGFMSLVFLKNVYIYWYLKRIYIFLSERFLSLKTGIFSKEISDISLTKLEGISVHQSLLGRWLNYGTLVISTGEISQSYKIQNPMEFRKKLLMNLN